MSLIVIFASLAVQAAGTPSLPSPIIDMHFHAFGADEFGPPGSKICAPYDPLPVRDPSKPIEDYVVRFTVAPDCPRGLSGPLTDEALLAANVAKLRQRNIIAVASGPAAHVQELQRAAPERVIPALSFGQDELPSIAELRRLHSAGLLKVLGELTFQYAGIAPDDPRIDPYYKLAEELDIPVGIHIGAGPPGVSYFGSPAYRMRHSNALALEEVLLRHSRLRLYVAHAGWPMTEAMMALMYAHPHVYADLSVINYAIPRAEFHAYLKRLVDAGLGKRIMFGSDQMVWPDAVDAAIEGIESATFLTAEQKQDIFYNNAARFLRLSAEGTSKHPPR